MILKPLRRQENPLIVFDLSQVDNFGSMFLALLIRCWKLACRKEGRWRSPESPSARGNCSG